MLKRDDERRRITKFSKRISGLICARGRTGQEPEPRAKRQSIKVPPYPTSTHQMSNTLPSTTRTPLRLLQRREEKRQTFGVTSPCIVRNGSGLAHATMSWQLPSATGTYLGAATTSRPAGIRGNPSPFSTSSGLTPHSASGEGPPRNGQLAAIGAERLASALLGPMPMYCHDLVMHLVSPSIGVQRMGAACGTKHPSHQCHRSDDIESHIVNKHKVAQRDRMD